ncbi:arabinogalactan oligomer / maltooligosaccharide transport system permease protein [Lachnospiraceae bacterium C10]|jgi:arabinogalactan oligomer/maltooligosaccharide transport system permease protein|nr:sugar ABC transporter permease [Lachnospiraceae bacterium]SCW81651.1 arabinogalactan oligomer / maltooligosaccharide transport system permease protein [Lachnospiraceae bacterium C10]SDW27992.1 carbohydrate ABC transporter membrane protein 2, CUT1 family [Lachnospiraceae bacterium KHCPX20]
MTARKLRNILVHILLVVLSVIWLFPLAWVIMISLRAEKGSYSTTFLPKTWTLKNYTSLFTDTAVFNFPRWFGNTLIVALCSCLLATFFIVSIAFVMSRLRFASRKLLLNVCLILGMFPGFMAMIAIYYILKGIGLTTGVLKLVSLILVYSGGAGILNFYVAKGFFDTIPKELDEAARIDGATKMQIFTKITLPLSKPIIVYTILTSFIGPWCDFIFSKVIIGTDAKYYTVAIGLWNMLQKENIYQWYTRFASGAVCISIPIAILYIFMQKYYTDGLTGAVKG